MVAVDALVVEDQIAKVEGIALHRGWPFERVDTRSFRLALKARNDDVYHLEVECVGFPAEPAAFHWRNPATGELDRPADAPAPFNYFHGSGRICAPWNRLASTPGGPHTKWERAGWQQHARAGGTVTLAAMVIRIHRELRRKEYQGRHP